MKKIIKKKWHKILLVILIGIVSIILAYNIYLIDIHIDSYYEDKIEQGIREFKQNNATQVDFNEIVPFKWDVAYVFTNDIEKEDFEKHTNYSIQDIPTIYTKKQAGDNELRPSEPIFLLSFIKDGKIVFDMRTDGFRLTNGDMGKGKTKIFSFTPNNSIFTISENEYGILEMTHNED